MINRVGLALMGSDFLAHLVLKRLNDFFEIVKPFGLDRYYGRIH